MLSINTRQNGSQFSQLSYESRKKLNYLKIFLFVGIAAIAFLIYYLHLLPARYNELMSYFLVLSISCNLVPVPTFPIVLYISHDYHIGWIVLLGSIGAAIAAFMEYKVIDFLMRFDRIAKLKQNGKYKKYAGYFDKFSFRSIMIASMIPLPVDVIRLLAITRKYKLWKFLTATFLGRLPRILIFAFLGSQLAYSKLIAIILLSATLLIELIRRAVKIYHRIPITERSI
ncbi:MAG TPA: DedA family protein [Bacteroidetes bacterium]|nr:DedA family protein [Bacteroidota bacterium]